MQLTSPIRRTIFYALKWAKCLHLSYLSFFVWQKFCYKSEESWIVTVAITRFDCMPLFIDWFDCNLCNFAYLISFMIYWFKLSLGFFGDFIPFSNSMKLLINQITGGPPLKRKSQTRFPLPPFLAYVRASGGFSR